MPNFFDKEKYVLHYENLQLFSLEMLHTFRLLIQLMEGAMSQMSQNTKTQKSKDGLELKET